MKKLKLLSILSVGILAFSLASCKTETPTEPTVDPTEPTETTKPTEQPTEPVKVEYALTIEYPDGTTNTIKMVENTTISLNDYVVPMDNMTFDGFYKEETFTTRVYTYTFTQNGKLYAKYNEVEDTKTEPSPEPTHTCEFEATYTYDSENHWKNCKDEDCELTSAKEAHTFKEEATEEYLFSAASSTSKALYYSHCEVCEAKGALFEYGERVYNTYKLNIETNIDGLSFEFDFKENVKVDYTAITNLINEHTSVKNKFDFDKIYADNLYENELDVEYLTANTTAYIKLDKLTRDVKLVTINLPEDTTKTLSLNRNSLVTISVLEDLNTNNNYEFVAWYMDEELTIPFEEFELTENVTLYADYTRKMEILDYTFGDLEYPEWYYNSEYNVNDVYSSYLILELSKDFTDLDVKITTDSDLLVDIETYSVEDGKIYVYYNVKVNDVLENNKYVKITGAKVTIDDKEMEDLEVVGNLVIDLSAATKATTRLTISSQKSDFVNSVQHIDSMNFVWYDKLKSNYDKYEIVNEIPENALYDEEMGMWYTVDEDEVYTYYEEKTFENDLNNLYYVYKTSNGENFVNILDEINLTNIDVLCTDMILEDDLYITTYNQYINSVFAYENYMGRFDLNGHTIYLTFDGYAGNGLFKNNYGEIYNGKVVISGARNAENNNEKYNTLDFSSALVENNYGYIHDLEITVNNFGYDFTKNHNVDSVIGVNREFALVEDVKINLDIKYVGTKLNRVLNPLITSNAGIFREVRGGSIYSHMFKSNDKQELQNIEVNIKSFECSDELKETGLVSLKVEDDNLPLNYHFNENYEIVPYEKENMYYGGNYYFDGTNYVKANSALLKDTILTEDLELNLNTGYGYTNTDQLKNMIYFLYINPETEYTTLDSYACEYGYLLPEFAMVAYDDCYIDRQYSNVCLDICICGRCVRVAAFTESYLIYNVDLCGMNVRKTEFYAVYDIYNEVDVYNYEFITPYYVNGFARNDYSEKPNLKSN